MPLQDFALHPVVLAPHLSDQPLVEAIQRAFPDEALDQVIAATGTQEQRRRLLPARLVIASVIAMGFWARDRLRDVLANLVEGLRERDPTPWRAWHLSAKSALTQARQRLGIQPLLALFRRVAPAPASEPRRVRLRHEFGVSNPGLSVPDWEHRAPGADGGTATTPVTEVARPLCYTGAVNLLAGPAHRGGPRRGR